MLVQREIDWRDDKRQTRLLKAARLKVSGACIHPGTPAGALGRLITVLN
jgi:hypothetical protein